MKILLSMIAVCILLTACAAPSPQVQILDSTPVPTRVQRASKSSHKSGSKAASSVAGAAAAPGTTGTASPSAADLPASTNVPASADTSAAPSASGKVPAFDHIVLILLENHDYEAVIGSPQMPHLNAWAKQYVLLTQYHAIRHPSLPNYISIVAGSNYQITKDCTNCYLNEPNLADRIEASGRTWKTYQEDMPSPCFVGNADPYVQKHNPFMYFDSIRLNSARCDQSVVPLSQLDADLSAGQLPNFSFIMPNMCHSSHNCGLDVADQWLNGIVSKLQASPALGKNSLIIITFDEANDHSIESCCGLGNKAGGRVAAVLISPLAKPGFADGEQLSHYSLLKTILTAWGLPDLGNTGMPGTQPIVGPWG